MVTNVLYHINENGTTYNISSVIPAHGDYFKDGVKTYDYSGFNALDRGHVYSVLMEDDTVKGDISNGFSIKKDDDGYAVNLHNSYCTVTNLGALSESPPTRCIDVDSTAIGDSLHSLATESNDYDISLPTHMCNTHVAAKAENTEAISYYVAAKENNTEDIYIIYL